MNWTNYDDVIGQMRQAGLVVDSLDVGRLRRCKVDGDRERRGWYSLHELRLDSGDTVLVGSFGVWRGAESNAQKVELKRTQLSEDQRKALKARIAEDRRRAEAERKRSAERAAARAQAMWARCSPDGDSAYLRRKGIGAHGVRFSPKGALVIPMLDPQGRVHGLQVIHAQPKDGRDKDFWPAGLAKTGNFFLMGPVPGPGSVLLVAEGYATAASAFEATGYPTAVAWDAGNLLPVAQALHGRYRHARVLVLADDDYLTDGNPGCTKAAAAALAVDGAWVPPTFSNDRDGKKITDFNDLHALEGLHVVRQQIEAKLRQLGWTQGAPAPKHAVEGGGDDGDELQPIEDQQELIDRYAIVYEMGDAAFDKREHKLVSLTAMRNACVGRIYRYWMESREKRLVRQSEVGFDPAGADPNIKCNLWGGWPTDPAPGGCETLLELLHYLCSAEPQADELYQWVLKWLAYPLQHPGAKMRTALVLHGPQGTGKNMFFEAYMAIFGQYGRIIDQAAVEDKFNDWASRKLFLIADEVVARLELYHTKNKLKSLITGEWVRINPKNMGAYDERNHVNMVFLSNEAQPLVLERDDRRYTVIWTPPKLDARFYETVRVEIQSGGVAALHHHLLNLELGDFKPWTLPPMTKAKADLIELSLDSTERFWGEWLARLVPLPLTPCRTEDLYDAYRHWCHRQGIAKPAQLSTFIGNCAKRPGADKRQRRYYPDGGGAAKQCMFMHPPNVDAIDDIHALTAAAENFADAVRQWRDDRSHLRGVA